MVKQNWFFPLMFLFFFIGLIGIHHLTEDLKAPEKQFVKELRDSLKAYSQQHLADTLFINLWASWCKPCKKEMPHLADLATSIRNQGQTHVQFIAVTDEDSNETKQVRKQKRAFFTAFQSIHEGEGLENTIHTLRGKSAFPTNLLIIKDSCVYKAGYLDKQARGRLKNRLIP